MAATPETVRQGALRRVLVECGWEDASVALQDALARVWKHRDRVRGHPNPPALVLRIVVQAAIDTLAAVPTDPGFVMHELPLLRMRALLARAQGDEDGYRDYRDRYRTIATDLGFEGHMQWAEEMT